MRKTLYVNRPLLNASDIRKWAIEQGFEENLLVPDMHVTICYSKKAVDWNYFRPMLNTFTSKTSQRSVQQFKPTIYVMTFESELLNDRWKQFIDGGASADFVPYTPHVSISYEQEGLDSSKMAPYTGPLKFGKETFSEIKLNE